MSDILKILWFGKTGQGIRTASSILAEMLVGENKYVQSLTESHFMKMGVPNQALNRVSDSPLRFPGKIEDADVGIILDPTLFHDDVIQNQMKDDALYIINSQLSLQAVLEKFELEENPVYSIDANSIAQEEIGSPYAAIPLLSILVSHFDFLPIPQYKKIFVDLLTKRFGNELTEANKKTIDRSLKEARKSWE